MKFICPRTLIGWVPDRFGDREFEKNVACGFDLFTTENTLGVCYF